MAPNGGYGSRVQHALAVARLLWPEAINGKEYSSSRSWGRGTVQFFYYGHEPDPVTDLCKPLGVIATNARGDFYVIEDHPRGVRQSVRQSACTFMLTLLENASDDVPWPYGSLTKEKAA